MIGTITELNMVLLKNNSLVYSLVTSIDISIFELVDEKSLDVVNNITWNDIEDSLLHSTWSSTVEFLNDEN